MGLDELLQELVYLAKIRRIWSRIKPNCRKQEVCVCISLRLDWQLLTMKQFNKNLQACSKTSDLTPVQAKTHLIQRHPLLCRLDVI